MKKFFHLIGFTIVSATSYCQAGRPGNEVSLDLLKAPSSPAFNMLGISPSLVEKPSDLTAFLVSVQNASGNFTSFPKNYAVELAPFLLLKKTGHTLDKFNSTNFKDVFQQTLQFSIGVSRQNEDDEVTDDSSSFTKAAFGFKFSFIRRPWSTETENLYNDLKTARAALLDEFDNNTTSDEIKELEQEAQAIRDSMVVVNVTIRPAEGDTVGQRKKREILKALVTRLAAINKTTNDRRNELIQKSETYAEVKRKVAEFKVEREKGAYLDFASGMVLDFPGDRFNSSVSKAGVWLTGGYDGENEGLSTMGIIRYLYQPDKIFADEAGILQAKNISTLDMGAKLSLAAASGRFHLSGEAIYRSVLNKDLIDPTWRLDLNVEYDVGKNQKLTFVFGKNFDGTITKGGNLLAALNFIKGFGSSKKISD